MRWICLILILFISVLFCFTSEGCRFFVYAHETFCNVEVLIDKFDEKLIKVNNLNIDDFIDCISLQNCKKFVIEDRVVIEGYSNKINNYIVLNDNKINIQISIFSDYCLIGCPLINIAF